MELLTNTAVVSLWPFLPCSLLHQDTCSNYELYSITLFMLLITVVQSELFKYCIEKYVCSTQNVVVWVSFVLLV